MCVVLCLATQLCLTLCDRMYYSVPGTSAHGDSPGKNTGVGCRALLQGIFPTQGWNPGLPPCRRILYHLSHQGSLVVCVRNVRGTNLCSKDCVFLCINLLPFFNLKVLVKTSIFLCVNKRFICMLAEKAGKML